jgi:hypothetical protein
MKTEWGITPRQAIERECARRGRVQVVATCIRLIREEPFDPELLIAIAGPGARKFFDGEQHDDTYWFRVWGARGLLWAWDDKALDAIRLAVRDEHWRVREMGLKVVARHELGDLMDDAAGLRDDAVPRVRAAAGRAVALLTAAGA